ncbi:MAG TPA: 16S rRNA (guanine(527)-N(7))-methyltransferase RsmG [Methyloradius sp.]
MSAVLVPQQDAIGSDKLLKKLTQGIEQAGLGLPDSAVKKLMDYLVLLQKWNKVHNLTAVRDVADMVTLHLLDSLSVLPHIKAKTLLDVGSGGGLPGIPLAICLPDLQVTVIDSNQKKTSFMRQAKAELHIDNLQVVSGRVEQYKAAYRFDIIISRAFSEISLFLNLTKHLLAENGKWLAMKGVYPAEELAQTQAESAEIIPLMVPGLEAQRHLVVIPFNQAFHHIGAA